MKARQAIVMITKELLAHLGCVNLFPDSTQGGIMKRFVIASALLTALPLGVAEAAGPFDGTYSGGEPAMGRMGCPATQATVSVVDSKITGKFTENQFSFNISGTVAADGT